MRRPAVVPAVLLAAGLTLAACSGGGSPSATGAALKERDQSTDVPFKNCDKAACTGEINGAKYEIVMPDKWNGTLLLYSHGYRNASPAPPNFEPVSTSPEPAPGWPTTKAIGQALLDKGYALAGSAYASNGWAVADGVEAGEDLHTFFVDNVGQPNRTIVWGDSLGGLITAVLAEQNPDWVSGAVPLCGVLAGPVKNFDLALDAAFAVKTLIYPQLKLTGFASNQEAVQNWTAAVAAISKAAGDVKVGVPRILMAAAIVDAPTQSVDQDGGDVASQVRALGEAVATALGFGTFGRYDVEQRVGGNPSTNVGVDYSQRITPAERQLIETVSPGSVDQMLQQLAIAPRVEANETARQRFAETGTPTGDIKDPTLTMHTAADPLVLVQNESVFAKEVQSSAKRTADLVQIFTTPPGDYTTAPYGAGHCNFTPESRLGVVTLMTDWVKNGLYPAGPAVPQALGPNSGYNPAFRPGPWPAQ